MTTDKERMYAAVEADDCHADELLKGFLRKWRKLHNVCEECFVEDGMHDPTCSHYDEENDDNKDHD